MAEPLTLRVNTPASRQAQQPRVNFKQYHGAVASNRLDQVPPKLREAAEELQAASREKGLESFTASAKHLFGGLDNDFYLYFIRRLTELVQTGILNDPDKQSTYLSLMKENPDAADSLAKLWVKIAADMGVERFNSLSTTDLSHITRITIRHSGTSCPDELHSSFNELARRGEFNSIEPVSQFVAERASKTEDIQTALQVDLKTEQAVQVPQPDGACPIPYTSGSFNAPIIQSSVRYHYASLSLTASGNAAAATSDSGDIYGGSPSNFFSNASDHSDSGSQSSHASESGLAEQSRMVAFSTWRRSSSQNISVSDLGQKPSSSTLTSISAPASLTSSRIAMASADAAAYNTLPLNTMPHSHCRHPRTFDSTNAVRLSPARKVPLPPASKEVHLNFAQATPPLIKFSAFLPAIIVPGIKPTAPAKRKRNLRTNTTKGKTPYQKPTLQPPATKSKKITRAVREAKRLSKAVGASIVPKLKKRIQPSRKLPNIVLVRKVAKSEKSILENRHAKAAKPRPLGSGASQHKSAGTTTKKNKNQQSPRTKTPRAKILHPSNLLEKGAKKSRAAPASKQPNKLQPASISPTSGKSTHNSKKLTPNNSSKRLTAERAKRLMAERERRRKAKKKSVVRLLVLDSGKRKRHARS